MLKGWFGGSNSEEKPQDNASQNVDVNPIPTPSTDDEWKELAEKSLAQLIEYGSNNEGWNEVKAEDGVIVYDKTLDGNPSHLIKAETNINASPRACYEFVADFSMETRGKWDEDLLFYNIIKNITDEIGIAHIAYNAPFPVTKRDFSTLRSIKEAEDGSFYVWACSAKCQEIPESTDGSYVRGNIIVGGFIIKPVEGKSNECVLLNINQIDPSGWIPTWVVNLSKTKPLGKLAKIRSLVESTVST